MERTDRNEHNKCVNAQRKEAVQILEELTDIVRQKKIKNAIMRETSPHRRPNRWTANEQ